MANFGKTSVNSTISLGTCEIINKVPALTTRCEESGCFLFNKVSQSKLTNVKYLTKFCGQLVITNSRYEKFSYQAMTPDSSFQIYKIISRYEKPECEQFLIRGTFCVQYGIIMTVQKARTRRNDPAALQAAQSRYNGLVCYAVNHTRQHRKHCTGLHRATRAYTNKIPALRRGYYKDLQNYSSSLAYYTAIYKVSVQFHACRIQNKKKQSKYPKIKIEKNL